MSSKDNLGATKRKSKDKDDIVLPLTPVKEPPSTSSKNVEPAIVETTPSEPPKKCWWKRCLIYMYDSEHGLYCGRSCSSWTYMILYSIMYLIFLTTFTMIFLYATLKLIKLTEIYNVVDKSALIAFSDNGIGLTATPTSLDSMPLISYTYGHSDEYNKYIKSLDRLLVKRKKRQVGNGSSLIDLGPCGAAPYGYGAEPCVIIRPNKQLRWKAKPIRLNSTKHLPEKLQQWLEMKDQKLWLYCDGYHSYDKEHIGSLQYYPYPPGFDPRIFPLDMQSDAPLIAIQISNFTLGLSLTVECKLWYDSGVSSIAFLLYVEPKSRTVKSKKA